jgi:hypothetical protein
MPISVFDFDETLPVGVNMDDNPPSLLTCMISPSASSITQPAHESHPLKIAGSNFTPRIPSTSEISLNPDLKRQGSALPNSSFGATPLGFGSSRHRSSVSSIVNTALALPSPAPQVLAKKPGYSRAHSQPRLSISRSFGLQNRPHSPSDSTPAAAVRNLNQEKDTDGKDAVINALRERLVEVEKERDEARRVVTEVRKALRYVEDGSLHSRQS